MIAAKQMKTGMTWRCTRIKFLDRHSEWIAYLDIKVRWNPSPPPRWRRESAVWLTDPDLDRGIFARLRGSCSDVADPVLHSACLTAEHKISISPMSMNNVRRLESSWLMKEWVENSMSDSRDIPSCRRLSIQSCEDKSQMVTSPHELPKTIAVLSWTNSMGNGTLSDSSIGTQKVCVKVCVDKE